MSKFTFSPAQACCCVKTCCEANSQCSSAQMDALCDQGCRPVGEAATVTSSHRGTIMQLDHQTALLVVSPTTYSFVLTALFAGVPTSCVPLAPCRAFTHTRVQEGKVRMRTRNVHISHIMLMAG